MARTQDLSKLFIKELNNLIDIRTKWLRDIIFPDKKQRGRPPKLDLNKKIDKLKDIATKALVPLALKELDKSISNEKLKRLNGNVDKKKQEVKEWFEKNNLPNKCVYILFGKNNEILYVGQTNRGVNRIIEHIDKHYSNKLKGIQVIDVDHYKKTSKVECLIQHLYEPPLNKNKAPKKKWNSDCPICKIHQDIESELKSIFT